MILGSDLVYNEFGSEHLPHRISELLEVATKRLDLSYCVHKLAQSVRASTSGTGSSDRIPSDNSFYEDMLPTLLDSVDDHDD